MHLVFLCCPMSDVSAQGLAWPFWATLKRIATESSHLFFVYKIHLAPVEVLLMERKKAAENDFAYIT